PLDARRLLHRPVRTACARRVRLAARRSITPFGRRNAEPARIGRTRLGTAPAGRRETASLRQAPCARRPQDGPCGEAEAALTAPIFRRFRDFVHRSSRRKPRPRATPAYAALASGLRRNARIGPDLTVKPAPSSLLLAQNEIQRIGPGRDRVLYLLLGLLELHHILDAAVEKRIDLGLVVRSRPAGQRRSDHAGKNPSLGVPVVICRFVA